MVEGAIIAGLGIAIGYLVKHYETKGLQSKYDDAIDQLNVARELEREREHGPDNWFDQ